MSKLTFNVRISWLTTGQNYRGPLGGISRNCLNQGNSQATWLAVFWAGLACSALLSLGRGCHLCRFRRAAWTRNASGGTGQSPCSREAGGTGAAGSDYAPRPVTSGRSLGRSEPVVPAVLMGGSLPPTSQPALC